jgi:prevent-host-death family protein
MDDVNLAEAKDHLEELMARAAHGEDVRITDPKHGTVVKLQVVRREPDLCAPCVTDTMEPFVPLKEDRVRGLWKGLMVPENLFDPMTEQELKDWYGDDEA